MPNNSHSTHDTHNKENYPGKKEILALAMAIVVICAIIAGLIFFTTGDSSEDNPEEEVTASTITEQPQAQTTEDNPRSREPRTTVSVDEEGRTTTRNVPHPDLNIPEGADVDEGIAQWRPGDPIYADPREGIVPTLTAPTTVRPMPNPESPDLVNPRYGEPKTLAKYFINQTFSLCVKEDTSYNDILRSPSVRGLVTSEFAERGMIFGGRDHTTTWTGYSNPVQCNRLEAFPSIDRVHVGGSNMLIMEVTVNQRVTTKNPHGMVFRQNITPIKGSMNMVFVDDKWLVSDFRSGGGRIPAMS